MARGVLFLCDLGYFVLTSLRDIAAGGCVLCEPTEHSMCALRSRDP